LATPQSPTRDGAHQRADGNPALQANLLGQVLSNANIWQAWQQVRQNKGTAGVDGITLGQFTGWVRPQWHGLREQLPNGRYLPQPAKRVRIPKDDASGRLLGIPTVLGRVVQQAIVQTLSPLFDPTFPEHSFGFRPNRPAHGAARLVQGYCQQQHRIAVDIDLSKFFGRVNHDKLMALLGRRIRDKGLLRLIGCYLRAGILDGNRLLPSHEGVPQGGPLSPLLSNVMLDPLDRELGQRGHRFARYADDRVILAKSPRAGERVLHGSTRFIGQDLKLKVNTGKSQVVESSQCKFLGFSFPGKHIRWHPKSVEKFKRRVRELAHRSWGVSMATKIRELGRYLRGWINDYGIADQYQQCVGLDHWIRRRIRMCYWKQWGRPRTKIRNLAKLGLPVKAAVACGRSSKGWWHSAKTHGINAALGLKYLKQQGLFSLRDGSIACHHGG
jgi:RNA-directed DNA polymerase